jgi:pilus assembly protein CpaE
MGHDVRFIVLNTDEAFGASLRTLLLNQEGTKLVAEVDEPALVGQAVKQFPVDVLLVNLDPSPDSLLPLIGEVASANHDLAIFAVSDSTDGQLILQTMRLGVKEFFPKPIDMNTFGEAIGKVAVGRVETVAQGKLITVVGATGGVGSTLLASNLAIELAALSDGQVTAVDLDFHYGQLATFLDLDPKYSIADLCGSPEALEPQVIGRALTAHHSGLQVLGRPNQLSEVDTVTGAACMGLLSHLLGLNEYVVTDGPTRFDVNGKSVLALSDVVFILVQQSVPCVRNAQRIVESMRDSGLNLDRAKLICNRLGRSVGHLSAADITATLGLEMFASIPNDWDTASGAINLGEPLMTHSPKSKLRIGIQEIAERLHGADASSGEHEGRKSGFIGRMFASN